MRDTSSGVEQLYRDLLLQRSGEERLKMGFSMHQLAKSLVLAAIRQEHPHASAALLRRELFIRFYGADFEEPALTRVASAIAEFHQEHT